MNVFYNKVSFFVLALLLFACKKDKSHPEPETVKELKYTQVSEYIRKYENGVVEVSYYPVDTTRSNSSMYDYFSFEKMEFIDAGEVKTDVWDIVFTRGGRTISANNKTGASSTQPWFRNDFRVALAGIMKPFNEVDTLPADLDFNTKYTLSTMNIDQKGEYDDWFIWAFEHYNHDTGFLEYYAPDTNKTHIWRLNNGRHVKFQMINVYNNKPEENSGNSELGYLSFRYYIAPVNFGTAVSLKTRDKLLQ